MNASSYVEINNHGDPPKTPYDGENMNDYSNNEENNDWVTPDPPTYIQVINDNSDKVTPDKPRNVGNNQTIDNDEEKITKKKPRMKQIMKT